MADKKTGRVFGSAVGFVSLWGLIGSVFLLIPALFLSCGGQSPAPLVRQEFIMDTSIILTLYDSGSEEVFDKIFDRLREIEAKMSAQNPDSEISQVSKNAGVKPVRVSEETYRVMKTALFISGLSGGAFDASIGPVVSLWDITGPQPHLATEEEIAPLLPLVDYRNIVLDDAGRTIFLKKAGMRLDFGGIAKGWAASEAGRLCREAGIRSGLLNMGNSTIAVLGTKPNGQPWRVGIQDPNREMGEILGILTLSDSIVGTSGTYERYFVRDGVRYHHIMDPKTGFPARSGLSQVTVYFQGDTDLGDGLSNTCFILGLEKGMDLIESLPGAAAIFVTDDKEVYLSSRVGKTFALSADGFTLKEIEAKPEAGKPGGGAE